ncbi:ABC-2 transporter permease [Candidatus Merdisoma sp. JLR.KK006]|uniref:ABC-2 transporter permease n=1 Tax=Candidatus Merdisoma sp. JLR.KK006 TaxID=3112626 RepID=UPI002FF1F625
MKGLLLKDIYNLKRLGKQYVITCAGMMVWSGFMKNYFFFSMMIMLCGVMSVVSSFSFDEAAHFEKYALTLPVTKKNLVQSKYVLLLAFLAGAFVIGILGSLLMSLVLEGGIDELAEQLVSAASVACLFLLAFSTMIPIIFKLGVEKGRMLLVAIYMGIFVFVWGGIYLLKDLGIRISDSTVSKFSGIGAAVILVFLFISYRVSVRIVEKKEW